MAFAQNTSLRLRYFSAIELALHRLADTVAELLLSTSGMDGTQVRTTRFAAIFLLAIVLQGCAAAALTVIGTGLGVGAGAGVEHTMNGIVYKTFDASLNEVRFATLKMFDHLGMPVTADQKTDEGWTLTATASDRTIDVELEHVTDKVTRMRVVANKGDIFFKDASTATEIINQTAQIVDNDARKPTKTKVGSDQKRS